MKKIFAALLVLQSICCFGQYAEGDTRRILILLDGSGSMVDPWNGTTKWAIAQKLVAQTIDSIQRSDPSVEIGLRVFGHQSPKALKDCKDSKLEVPIARNTAGQIRDALKRITPQGNTPIAYSLFLAAGDFPETPGKNSIILITDGIENCEGDPCASADVLKEKHIVLKPFIIGLGLNDADKEKFDCVGNYYDASDEVTFKNAMNIVISQALNITTTQINLIDAFGLPTVSNIDMTFYDAHSGEEVYDYVHALNAGNLPDTLFLNPAETYDIVVHSTPPVTLKNVEIKAGQHNIIGIDVPLGTLQLQAGSGSGFSEKQCVVRDRNTGDIICVQNFNTSHQYLSGKYDMEILTLPEIWYRDYEVLSGSVNTIHIDPDGTLAVTSSENYVYSIYDTAQGKIEKIYESTLSGQTDYINLLPGTYKMIVRSNIKKSAENTKEIAFTIKSNKTYTIRL